MKYYTFCNNHHTKIKSVNKMDKNTSIKLNNICVSKFTIIFLWDCRVSVVCNGVKSHFIENDLIFLPKGVKISVFIERCNNSALPLYHLVSLDGRMLTSIKNIICESDDWMNVNHTNDEPSIKNKIMSTHANKKIRSIFFKALETKNTQLKILKLSYIILMSNNKDRIVNALLRSSATLFSDRIRYIIGEQLNKNWRLSNIAEHFNISEITVRKRLESENTTFHDIVLNCRMSKAMELILQGDAHINKIARAVGFSSTSYFIKTFKGFYGVTPKKLSSYLKS